MSRPFSRLAGLALLALLVAAPPARAAEPFVVGVNVANPQWLSPARQAEVLDQLAAAKVATVRFPFMPPSGDDYGATIEFIRRVSARGMGVVLILYLEFPPGTPVRPKLAAYPEMWSEPALSAADADLFRAKYGPLLSRIDRAGVKLTAIELGNEINWTAFNGEFPIPGRGRVMNADDLLHDPIGRRIAAGYRAYLRTAAALKTIRDGLTLNRDTPILSAGLADIGVEGEHPGSSLDSVSIPATLAYLRAGGLDRYVDGYGVHTYPAIGSTPETRLRALEANVLSQCRAGEGGKPCWLTEWGFPSASTRCGEPDDNRARLVDEMRGRFRELAAAGRLKAAIYFQWDGDDDQLGIHRCGRLTPSGVQAVAPLPPRP
jgi:hypothetical protein